MTWARALGIPLALLALSSPAPAQVGDELSAFVESRRRAMDDASRPIAERETVALEVAAALDRAAWSASTAKARSAAWDEARAVLDGFSSRNPGHPRSRLFAFQAAVYLWAEGQGLARQAESGDADARARASSALDGAIARLRPIVAALRESDDALAQNARFRLARAELDRARLDPKAPSSVKLREDALKTLQERPITEAALTGFAQSLRAELLAEAGNFDEARAALEASAKAPAPPPESERLSALVRIAEGTRDFDAARAAVEGAKLDPAEKGRLKLRLALARRAALEPGPARGEAESEAFDLITGLKGSTEYPIALRDLARAVDEPSAALGPEAWSLLAEGASALGEADRASRLDVIAAGKAEARGDLALARQCRFRAAAVAFGAGRFARAEALFARVADDPDAGPLRARAGMLRALSRGRGLAAGEPGMTRRAYLDALADQVRRFPDDPATGEARWLLGRARLEDGDRDGAVAQWEAVPREHSRWIDARLALATLRREELSERRLVDDEPRLRTLLEAARAALAADRKAARDESERIDLDLESVRLELTPGIGDARGALDRVELIRRLPLREDQRDSASALRVAALASADRLLDAERAAMDLTASASATLEAARTLDRLAASARSDRLARRVGGIERTAADRLAKREGLTAAQEAEARLRRARGRMLSGDLDGARSLVRDWSNPAAGLATPALLSDAADLLAGLSEPARAVPLYRLVAKRSAAGSPRWLWSRLGQARALMASGEITAARHLVEGTELLHPDLGGPALREEFAALHRKLDRP